MGEAVFFQNISIVNIILSEGQVWYLIASIPDLCSLSYFIVSYKRKYVHDVKLNLLVKLAQENVARWTDRPDMTIVVD